MSRRSHRKISAKTRGEVATKGFVYDVVNDAINNSEKGLRKEIEALKSWSEEKFRHLGAMIEENTSIIQRLAESIEGKTESIDLRLHEHNERLDGHDRQISIIQSKFT